MFHFVIHSYWKKEEKQYRELAIFRENKLTSFK